MPMRHERPGVAEWHVVMRFAACCRRRMSNVEGGMRWTSNAVPQYTLLKGSAQASFRSANGQLFGQTVRQLDGRHALLPRAICRDELHSPLLRARSRCAWTHVRVRGRWRSRGVASPLVIFLYFRPGAKLYEQWDGLGFLLLPVEQRCQLKRGDCDGPKPHEHADYTDEVKCPPIPASKSLVQPLEFLHNSARRE